MKRDPNLRNLSEHHHHVLVEVLEIRKAAEASEPGREGKLRHVGEALLRFWQERGRIHFQEEEQVLLPEYARHARLDQDSDIMRMLADHAEIRARLEDLQKALAEKRFEPDLVIELGRMLYEHVRLEEDRIFPRLEGVLSGAELGSVGSRLTRLHDKTG